MDMYLLGSDLIYSEESDLLGSALIRSEQIRAEIFYIRNKPAPGKGNALKYFNYFIQDPEHFRADPSIL
jgi:hypothetical protein